MLWMQYMQQTWHMQWIYAADLPHAENTSNRLESWPEHADQCKKVTNAD